MLRRWIPMWFTVAAEAFAWWLLPAAGQRAQIETRLVPHPERGTHIRASRFRPAMVLRPGCDDAYLDKYGHTCDYDGMSWHGNWDLFSMSPVIRFKDTALRTRIDIFQFIMLSHPSYINIGLYDAYYTWGDVLALPTPSSYNELLGSEFYLKVVSDANLTLAAYRSPALNHTYPFPGDYFVTAALHNRVLRNMPYISIMKIKVVDNSQPCRPRIDPVGLGPCGRPQPVSVHRAVRVRARSWVAPECGRPLVQRTGLQYVVLYAAGRGRAPVPQCGGTSAQPVQCTRGNTADCTYELTIDPRCLRPGETAKVVLRQMWHRKTEVLVEALAVGYLAPSGAAVRATIDGAPLVFLSDVETLILNGTGSRNLATPDQPLFYSWTCDQCDKSHSLYQAFVNRRLNEEVIEIADELRYGPPRRFEFTLRVSNGRDSDSATISVRVPGDRDDEMELSCPCCEFGALNSEDLLMEVRPLRTRAWGTRYPLVTWTVAGPQPLGFLTEQRGAVLLVPAGNVTRPGPYRLTASAWNQRPFADVYYVLTREVFESQGLREQIDLPPTKGRCVLSPEKGFAVRTVFQLECTDFADPEGGTLNYGFYFCTHEPDKLGQFEGARPRPWHSCTLMKSSLDDGNFTGVLPAGGNTTEAANCTILVFVNDNVGQYVYVVVPVVIEIGSCSDIKLETAEDYARKSHQSATDAILSFIKSSSILLKSKFYKECERNGTTTADPSRQADVLDDYIEYLKNATVTTEGELHSSVSVLTSLVPENISEATENFTKAVVELMDDYTNTYENLTLEEGTGRIADLTASIGGELIEGLTAVLDLKAPTPWRQPVVVPTKYKADSDCITVEKLVNNIARVAVGVARVVDTEEEDININVKEYEVWIRESKRRGFLGTSDGTRVRVDIATEGQTAIVFPSSPFRCHETSKLTNTQVVSIQTSRNIAEAPVSVGVPVEGYLKRNAPIDFKGHVETYETSFSNVSVHSINVTEPGVYLKLDFIPSDGDRRVITAVAMGRPPTRSDFLEQNRFQLSRNVPNENRIELVAMPTVVMVAVLPLTKDAKSALQDPYRRRGDDNCNLTYKLRSTLYSCLFWNSTQQAYSSAGCRVLMDSDEQFVHCTCEHNSIFAGGLFIAPHPINFTDLGFLLRTMSSNLVMVIILFFVWTIYLFVMWWAIKQDLRDEGAAGIEYLEENEQDDSFGYLVSVYTWFLKGSGTTSRVLLKIHGSEEESREVVLRDGARNPLALQAGGRDWYFLSHPSSLGDIEAISLTLELKGNESSWNLNTVVVRDLQTTSRTVFVIDDVLIPDEYKGSSTFTFEAADESLLRNPWRIFSSRIIRYFREEHLIFSIFSRLPTSNFTRKQRASAALFLVTTGMMASLMFYGLDPDEEEFFSLTFLYSLFALPTRREVIVAVQSTLLVTPLAFLVLLLFERSRPPAFRRKPAVPKVYAEDVAEDVVEDWVRDTTSSAESSKTGNVPKTLLTTNAQENPLPSWVSVLAWFLCLSTALIASVLIVLYGLTYGYLRSLSWVRCNLINVIFSEFVISPLKILCLSAVMACVLKAPIEMEHIPVRFIE